MGCMYCSSTPAPVFVPYIQTESPVLRDTDYEETCSSHINDPIQNEELAVVNKKLEEKCWSRKEEISVLQIELADAKEQLKVEIYTKHRNRFTLLY
ncbi:hypothetical protein CTI12_AA136410 [Artemisia annua]|uniref:Uncharacterized protein n=1 Tax=Artemisia annua TaxID=35608 RepID=A0A2U1PMD6_ARTAN|nr:hypothetical protein CTI12_AA136410 [Artemisia annua]